jgi:hypothetical protein
MGYLWLNWSDAATPRELILTRYDRSTISATLGALVDRADVSRCPRKFDLVDGRLLLLFSADLVGFLACELRTQLHQGDLIVVGPGDPASYSLQRNDPCAPGASCCAGVPRKVSQHRRHRCASPCWLRAPHSRSGTWRPWPLVSSRAAGQRLADMAGALACRSHR